MLNNHGEVCGFNIAITARPATKANCNNKIQPRRRPKKPGEKWSNIGAHRNLYTYGCPIKVNEPMAAKLTPLTVYHACNVVPTNASGNPDEKPNNKVTTIRQERAKRQKEDSGLEDN